MGRLEAKHWALIGAFLTATGTTLGGLHHWSDITPLVLAGMLGQLGVLLGAVFAGAPQNPKWKRGYHPGRRHYDATPAPPTDSVSDLTRSKL